jgi:hypothetical protein
MRIHPSHSQTLKKMRMSSPSRSYSNARRNFSKKKTRRLSNHLPRRRNSRKRRRKDLNEYP